MHSRHAKIQAHKTEDCVFLNSGFIKIVLAAGIAAGLQDRPIEQIGESMLSKIHIFQKMPMTTPCKKVKQLAKKQEAKKKQKKEKTHS